MEFKKIRFTAGLFAVLSLLSVVSQVANAQSMKPSKIAEKPAPSRRISFAEAQKLLAGESEGNLSKQPGKFTRTRLGNGRVLEVYYPIVVANPARRGKTATAPGYGVLYESEASFKDSSRPRHALEDLIPDGHSFVAGVPMLVARLEKRLGTKLDYSRASLRRLDSFIAGQIGSNNTDPRVFQELTAYYGEVLRRSLDGEWKIREEKISSVRAQAEPNILFMFGGKAKEIKPWSSVLSALLNEDLRGVKISKIFENDLKAAQ